MFARSLEAVVACENDQIVGYFTLVRQDEDTIELDCMFVLPECIGQGIGTAMMQEVLRLARSHGAQELMLIADPNAVGFYERFAAKQVGEHQSSIPGRTIPVMRIGL